MTKKKAKAFLLLSDLDMVFAHVSKIKFAAAGFETKITDSYKQALALIKKMKPDIVMTDILLKDGDGFSLISEIRKQKGEMGKVNIVVLTELMQKEDRERALRAGADEYMVKSEISLNKVIEEIGTLLKKEE